MRYSGIIRMRNVALCIPIAQGWKWHEARKEQAEKKNNSALTPTDLSSGEMLNDNSPTEALSESQPAIFRTSFALARVWGVGRPVLVSLFTQHLRGCVWLCDTRAQHIPHISAANPHSTTPPSQVNGWLVRASVVRVQRQRMLMALVMSFDGVALYTEMPTHGVEKNCWLSHFRQPWYDMTHHTPIHKRTVSAILRHTASTADFTFCHVTYFQFWIFGFDIAYILDLLLCDDVNELL